MIKVLYKCTSSRIANYLTFSSRYSKKVLRMITSERIVTMCQYFERSELSASAEATAAIQKRYRETRERPKDS